MSKRKRDENDDLLLKESQAGHGKGATPVAVPAPITLSAKPLDDHDVVRGRQVDVLIEDENQVGDQKKVWTTGVIAAIKEGRLFIHINGRQTECVPLVCIIHFILSTCHWLNSRSCFAMQVDRAQLEAAGAARLLQHAGGEL